MQDIKNKITPKMTLGELARLAPNLIPWFYENNLDFYCGGNMSLEAICQEQAKPWQQFLLELERPLKNEAAKPLPHFPEGDMPGLIEYILARFHAGHRRDFSNLTLMFAEILKTHGDRDPNLPRMAQLWSAIIADVEPHMQKEENVLFPLLKNLENQDATEASRFMNPLMPMAVMRREHEILGPLLEELITLTDFFRPPSWACATFTALYRGLAHFDQEIRLHIHLENNLLFPMAETRYASIKGNDITPTSCQL